jgi:KUP system potassium uptake protein
VQLGYSPRTRITHTSDQHIGQIYVGSINWILMLACIGLVLGFRESANLAAAYGVAVTTTMVLTTVLFYVVAREHFHWSATWVVPVCAVMFVVDVSFFGATLFKIPDGGWFPLIAGIAVFTLLSTWRSGRLLVQRRLHHRGLPIETFLSEIAHVHRVPGEGAYLFATPFFTPPAVIANLRHNDALHETVLLVAIATEKRPRVSGARRADVHDLGHGFHQVILRYGFMELPDVPRDLRDHVGFKVAFNADGLTYFIGRESIRVTPRPGMARWREHLFAFMSRNSGSAATYFGLPTDQTLELGLGVEL